MNEIIVLILDFLEVFIAMFFYINMNKCKYKLPVVILIWSTIVALFVFATSSLRPLAEIRGPFHLLTNFLLSLWLFSGKWYKKLLVVIYHVAILFVGELLALQIYIVLYGSPKKEFLSLERTICTIFYVIFFSILVSIVTIINKKIKWKQLLLSLGMQLVISISFLALVFMCFFENSSGILENQLVFLISVSIPLIIINLFMFTVIDRISKIAIREKELEYIESRNENEYAYYKLALESEKKISEMRHDMVNYMQIAMSLSNDSSPNGKKLIEEFYNLYPRSLKYCDNEIINTVIALKTTEMERLGIKAEVEMLSAFSSSPYSDLDLSSILANLIDNAITATETYNKDKQIRIVIGIKQNHFIIMVTNPSDKDVDIDNAKTTKENTASHGLGLKIIKKTVNKYGGIFTIEKVDNLITALAITEINK